MRTEKIVIQTHLTDFPKSCYFKGTISDGTPGVHYVCSAMEYCESQFGKVFMRDLRNHSSRPSFCPLVKTTIEDNK